MEIIILCIISLFMTQHEAKWVCLNDVKQCPDGSNLRRDISNNCVFPECPISIGIGPVPPMLPPSPMPPIIPIPPPQTACCDPLTRPDGTNGNPICFEGSACCPDGTWSCSIGNGVTFPCGGKPINKVNNPEAFGKVCTNSKCPAGQCYDPWGNCQVTGACFANPCEVNGCPAAASCEANYCGGCHAIFKDINGNVIETSNCNRNTVGCGIDHCSSYYDGCNSCGCRSNGVALCSMRPCMAHQMQIPYCTGCEPGYILNDITKKCEACMCSMVYSPVCCDGKEYSNQCEANCQKASNCFAGLCPLPPMARPTDMLFSCLCPMIADPVCCSDGVTYSNSCNAACEGASGCTQGACIITPIAVPIPLPVTLPVSLPVNLPCGGFANCDSYNDGCNNCICGNNGMDGCTRMLCAVQGIPKCTRCSAGYRMEGNVCII